MCNRCNECNHVFLNNRGRRNGCGCGCNWGNNWDNDFDWNNGFDGFRDDEVFEEAQRIINRVECRRGRENRCARQFVCCMRNIRRNNWD